MSAGAEDEVKLAEARVLRARDRLGATVDELRRRAQPQLLLRNAWNDVRDKSITLADDAFDGAKARPAAAAGIAAGVFAVVLRRPIGRLLRRLVRRKRDTRATEAPGDGL